MALLATYLNELGLATDYPITSTLGGTIAEVSTQAHQGTQSLRANRTSSSTVMGQPGGFAGQRTMSGYFWLWIAALPSGGDTPIFSIVHNIANNMEITLSSSGQVKAGQQGLLTLSSASATLLTAGSWNYIRWEHDSSTGTASAKVTVNSDAQITTSWAQAAEDIAVIKFGSANFVGASTYDLFYDDGAAYSTTAEAPAFTSSSLPYIVLTTTNALRVPSGRTTTHSPATQPAEDSRGELLRR